MGIPRSPDDGWHVLLVEDNPGDVGLTKVALESTGVKVALSVARDGSEALDFVHRRGAFADAPRPDVVLLDLNLPRVHGLQVLQEMKADRELRRIPVGILTTSESEDDIMKCYAAHANWYMTKPAGLDRFMAMMQRFTEHWFDRATLPPY